MKVFNDRFQKNIGEANMTQLVQLLAMTQETNDLNKSGSKKSSKPKVMFISPQMITQPGETVAKVDVILTQLLMKKLAKKVG